MQLNEQSNKIWEIVKEYWDENHFPMLISKLGVKLDQETKDFLSHKKIKVKQYIEENMKDNLVIMKMESYNNAFAVLPKENVSEVRDVKLEKKSKLENKKVTPKNNKKYGNNLSTIFNNLSKDELSRIKIPADLVVNLIERM